MQESIKTEVQAAVEVLGYPNAALESIELARAGFNRVFVYVNGMSLGIYDLDKHAFVD